MINIDALKKEHDEILEKLSDPEFFRGHTQETEKAQKRFAELDKIIEKSKEFYSIEQQLRENESILKAREDPELLSLAEAELPLLKEQKEKIAKELENLMEGRKETGSKYEAVILEIRPGTGGDEASLFAGDLLRMYKRFAERSRWNTILLNLSDDTLGGIKEAALEISNPEAYQALQYEAGVHRVQRIPVTEKSGRIHTSTATVALLPKAPERAYAINPADLEIQTFRSSGPGGQNVNRRETAVRIIHKPSGTVVSSQTERGQLANKENALSILRSKLLMQEQEKSVGKISETRRAQVGSAERSEKIRTYNFPQDRVTDHRIKKSWHNIEQIMDGNLDEIVESLKQ